MQMKETMAPGGIPSPSAELFLRYHGRMLRRARCIVSDWAEAEDVVSDCWIALLHRTPMLMRMEEPVRCAYIMRSVHNRAVDALRRRAVRLQGLAELRRCAEDCGNPGFADRALLRDALRDALDRLPPREREVTLRKLRDSSTAEISLALNIRPVTVRVCWNRARKHLRAMAEDLLETHP